MDYIIGRIVEVKILFKIIINNLISLLIHIVISIVSVFTFLVFGLSTAKWVSEEAALRHHNRMMVFALVIIVVMLIIYFIAGKVFLKKQDKIYKNFLSTVIVLIIELFLWLTCVVNNIQDSGYPLYSLRRDNYCLYNGYSGFYLYESETNNIYIYLLFAFLPSIVMALGMFHRKKAE